VDTDSGNANVRAMATNGEGFDSDSGNANVRDMATGDGLIVTAGTLKYVTWQQGMG
jgi:hypothetical protein